MKRNSRSKFQTLEIMCSCDKLVWSQTAEEKAKEAQEV